MRVLSIEPFRTKRRLVTFDDWEKIALYPGEIRRYGLEEQSEISREVLEELVEEVLIPRGRRRVLHLLESMDRTEASLRQKLKESYFPQCVIEDAIAYGKKFHYIDDARYLQNYFSGKITGKSIRQIRMELEKKGIDRELLNEAIEKLREERPEVETETACRLLQKKLKDTTDSVEIQKAKQYLFRRGFSYSTVEDAMRTFSHRQQERECVNGSETVIN